MYILKIWCLAIFFFTNVDLNSNPEVLIELFLNINTLKEYIEIMFAFHT